MKIGIRVAPRTSGGGRVFVENLANALDRNGTTSIVFSMGAPEQPWNVTRAVDVPVAGGAVTRLWRGEAALRESVTKHPVDIMVNMGNEVTPVPGIPSVLWPMTVAPLEEAALRRLGTDLRTTARWRVLRQSIGRAVSKADAFVFNSHYTRALYTDHYSSVADKPSTIIWPAPSLDLGAMPETTIPGGPPPRPYLLAVSHLYPYKMVFELVQGFAIAKKSGIEHSLVVAGKATDPAYAQRIQHEVQRAGLSSRVQLLGDVDPAGLPQLYRGADLFISPSISENAASFTLLDAFAYGVPTIASSTSSMPEMCQDAVRYFDPRSPQQLASAILQTLGTESLRAEMSRRGRAQFDLLPSWDTVATGLLHFSEQLVEP